ncbi:site-2 protease family protein [Winogradskyella rapida]|uniref:Zinc metalloprotease n=1 Tax=Winogradskyella rapida TaxID=549701 RepID=A0ABW3KRE9_9FLAO
MNVNLNIGRVLGAQLKVHWTFFLLIIWIVVHELQRGGHASSVLFNIALVFAIFIGVILHELGHAFMAKRFGVRTTKITLLPIGGIAHWNPREIPPKHEILIVLAGPFVNLVLALLLYFTIPIHSLYRQSFTDAYEVFASFSFQNFLFFIFLINAGLVLVNMLPAFPLDGGRLLRALLGLRLKPARATQMATSLGQVIAIAFLLLGLLYHPVLIFIALFIIFGAYTENLNVQHTTLLKGHTVEEAMLLNITTFKPKDSIDLVVNTIISGTEINFIVVESGQIKGLLNHGKIIAHSAKNVLVEAVMDPEFQTVNASDDLSVVYPLIYAHKQALFPVIHQGRLLGAIDAINLNEYIALQTKLTYKL